MTRLAPRPKQYLHKHFVSSSLWHLGPQARGPHAVSAARNALGGIRGAGLRSLRGFPWRRRLGTPPARPRSPAASSPRTPRPHRGAAPAALPRRFRAQRPQYPPTMRRTPRETRFGGPDLGFPQNKACRASALRVRKLAAEGRGGGGIPVSPSPRAGGLAAATSRRGAQCCDTTRVTWGGGGPPSSLTRPTCCPHPSPRERPRAGGRPRSAGEAAPDPRGLFRVSRAAAAGPERPARLRLRSAAPRCRVPAAAPAPGRLLPRPGRPPPARNVLAAPASAPGCTRRPSLSSPAGNRAAARTGPGPRPRPPLSPPPPPPAVPGPALTSPWSRAAAAAPAASSG